MSGGAEFSRMIDLRRIGGAPLHLVASEDERAALARRFGLESIARLEATVTLLAEGDVVNAKGRLDAAWVQACAISGEDLPQRASEAVALRFVPEQDIAASEEEIELSAADCDEIGYRGHTFDLGEALAQTMALAIDPFAVGPDADRARQAAGIVSEGASGPFAALAGLKIAKD